ncbi:MAG: SsrA-binding protein SmpB [Bacilli bacterium]|nr:SsrA-binding protein SmpB [Bacilli bacterium]MBQ8901662.1 SsrA-binding protein SmpB [Bacilli bacterium]
MLRLSMEIVNRKAKFDYFIESEIESGIVLKGTEIKSLRKGSADLKDTYVRIKNNEAYIINMYIAKYEEGNIFNHDERRERKLLLHKKEIIKLSELCNRDGYTLIPVRLYLKKNLAKVSIGVCKGKKNYDKRESIKEKDLKRLER